MRAPLITSAALALALAGAAHAQTGTAPSAAGSPIAAPAPSPSDSDPWEGFNRKSYAFSQWLDRVAIRPGAIFYKRVVPSPIRTGLRNAFQNLGEPLVAVNDAIGLRPSDFARSSGRFVVNSTVGLAGLVDVMAHEGVPHHDNGFGLTLGRLGVKPGPYIYLPVLGPTTVRDGFGQGVDVALNPFTWINYPHRTGVGISTGIVGGVDLRGQVDDDLKRLKGMSTDEYATLRSFYLQNRQSQITGGVVDVNALPDFDDPGAAAKQPAPGSVSPTGAPPQSTLPNAPSGDAAALPHPSSPEPVPPATAPH